MSWPYTYLKTWHSPHLAQGETITNEVGYLHAQNRNTSCRPVSFYLHLKSKRWMKVDDWTFIMTTHSFFHTEGQETYQPLTETETYKPISNYKVGHFPQF